MVSRSYEDILVLVEKGDLKDAKVFVDGLQSDDPFTKWASIKGCGVLAIQEVIPSLFELISSDNSKAALQGVDIPAIVSWSLSKFDYEILEPYVKTALTKGSDEEKANVADLLGLISDTKVIPVLDTLMNEEGRTLSYAALSLSKKGEQSVSILEKHLNENPALEKIVYILDALKKIDSESSTEALSKFFIHNQDKELEKFKSRFV